MKVKFSVTFLVFSAPQCRDSIRLDFWYVKMILETRLAQARSPVGYRSERSIPKPPIGTKIEHQNSCALSLLSHGPMNDSSLSKSCVGKKLRTLVTLPKRSEISRH